MFTHSSSPSPCKPLLQYAKLLQIVQAYCIISTGVRISCTNQVYAAQCCLRGRAPDILACVVDE